VAGLPDAGGTRTARRSSVGVHPDERAAVEERGTSVRTRVVVVLVVLAVAGLVLGLSRPWSSRHAGSAVGTSSPSATASRSTSSSPSASSPSAEPTPAVVAASAAVRDENARPGTPGALIPPDRGRAPGLEAYADRVSVLPGESVGLYVSTETSEPVTARALRIGYYGGVGQRQVWTGTFTAGPQPAAREITAPIPDAGGLVDSRAAYAPWSLSTTVSTRGWPEGAYVIRLDAGAASRYVLLTVRSADAVGRVLLVNAPMTWQAYNTWGGRGLYGDEGDAFAKRSLAVSFDRPYSDGYGAGRFFTYDTTVIREGEKLGLPLAWATDYDVATDPALLDGATAIVFGGHAEYWTGPMHDAVVQHVADGANLAVFGANTSYWRVRLAGASTGLEAQPQRRDGRPRLVVGPKSPSLDPLAVTDPAGATSRFRDNPHPRPEEALTGMRYDCYPAKADWVVSDASWWGYAGTGLHDGDRLPDLVGPESDRVYPSADRPSPMDVVAYTRLSCGGHETAQTGVYWSNAAGAGVFAAGTMGWRAGADPVGLAVATITDNVLRAFASPHAGRTSPAVENVDRFWLPAKVTSGSV